jgi:hypothetical protein
MYSATSRFYLAYVTSHFYYMDSYMVLLLINVYFLEYDF